MIIKGNSHYKYILYWDDLTDSEQNELIDNYDNIKESCFFRYKGNIWDINDFMAYQGMGNYDGYMNLSAFDGLFININRDEPDKLQVYHYME